MKKIYTYILMIACATMFAGCQKDFDGILTAEIENYNGGDDKVFIDNTDFACWHDGDMVLVNGTLSTIDFQGQGENKKATISYDQPDGTFMAIYPAQLSSYANGGYNYVFPTTQVYEKDANGKQVVKAPMVAYTSTDHLAFKNMASLVEITISKKVGKKVKYIEVESDKALSGTTTFTYDDGNGITMAPLTNTSNKVELQINNDADGDLGQGKKYYIYLPPFSDATLSVKVYFNDGSNTLKIFTKSTTNAVSLSKNQLGPINITDVTVNQQSYVWGGEGNDGTAEHPYIMKSAYDLKVLYGKDLNIKASHFKQEGSITLTPGYKGINSFRGVYDGNGQTIYNNSNEPIFGSIRVAASNDITIKNLNVVAGLKQKDKDCGGIAGTLIGATDHTITIEGCTISGSIEGKNSVGGIAGSVSNLGSYIVKNCTVDANIIGSDFVGGIFGYTNNSNGSIENCSVNGTVSAATSQKGEFIGYKNAGVITLIGEKEGNNRNDDCGVGSLTYPSAS